MSISLILYLYYLYNVSCFIVYVVKSDDITQHDIA